MQNIHKLFRRSLHTGIYTSLFLLLLTSCKKDFLEFTPKAKLIASTANDYQLLMNNYTFYTYSYPGGWNLPMLMGDELAAQATYFNAASTLTQRGFRWDATIYDPTDNTYDLSTFLTNLYSLNSIINEVMGSQGDDTLKNKVKAEALATRAWVYFQLINFYGKPYNAATAATDPGFPLITLDDITQTSFTRSTVQATYDFIVNDLTAAIPYLPVNNGVRTMMSKPAAEGILGKVYLFMGKNSDALTQLTAAINDVAGMANGPRLYDYNTESPNSPLTSSTDLTESVLFKTFGNYNSTFYGNGGLILTPAAAALYGAGDLRLQFYSSANTDGSAIPGGMLRKVVQYSRYGLELADLYMLIAECKARLNDLAGAKAALETLRSHRMPAADATIPSVIAGDQGALIKFIIDERVREYAAEGYRWFDMRRLSTDPLFSGQTFTHYIYAADGSISTTVTLDAPNRLTMQIPPYFINGNGNMQNNP